VVRLAGVGLAHPAGPVGQQHHQRVPGMIMSATALLEKNPHPSPSQIVRAMQGNVCRCGTHPRIIDAIEIASKS
jgi:aerobic-type carbon monoxide dehydrogenase small subunit (CoxS/CutS family)